jgi:hypothetical protein
VTWLHCIAKQTSAIRPDEMTGMIRVLFPASYVTAIQVGPPFESRRRRTSTDDLGLFPPIYPPPADGLPLAEIDRVLADLLVPERN